LSLRWNNERVTDDKSAENQNELACVQLKYASLTYQ